MLRGVWELMEEMVFPVRSTDVLFNQYRDEDPAYDLDGAHEIRRENLRNYLSSFGEPPPILLVGEAPGPYGCRFSGVPFTSEAQLCGGELPYPGHRTGLRPSPHREASATILRRVLLPHQGRFFLWNCVPFHPHRPDRPLSIRTPCRAEVEAHSGILREMHRLLAPQAVVAVGRIAERALGSLGIPCIYVRHPSQGGSVEFASGIRNLLRDVQARRTDAPPCQCVGLRPQ